ncbi:unnamed protein product [Spirodela intermedia]|uniref:Protein kinase domain-containing protein n=1 Tax=Spirodela intermedia TaxID=51605 RepID=A0A7I8JFX0_SPIIN|nr:unnamed protein product [Spirodela intermedia]CAA6669046.1 unnamed protein product [Spirodela intermedia]
MPAALTSPANGNVSSKVSGRTPARGGDDPPVLFSGSGDGLSGGGDSSRDGLGDELFDGQHLLAGAGDDDAAVVAVAGLPPPLAAKVNAAAGDLPPVGVVPKLPRWLSGKEIKDSSAAASIPADVDFCLFKPSWKSFSFSELQHATDNFKPENLIGKGGYAEVYRGRLPDGRLVAVKKLTRGSPEEILLGFGVDGGMHIVLQLSPHGSLAPSSTATPMQRRIIHRDIKAANILLSDDFEAQICDFGLAKWLPDQWTHHTVSTLEGTFGYLAPEYSMHGIVNEKTDVYAFGVLLLELITGRRALDATRRSLNDVRALVDPAIGAAVHGGELRRAVLVASLCIQQSSIRRPKMSEVAKLLGGGDEGPEEGLRLRQRPLLRRTFSEELWDAGEVNAAGHLNDLNRHKQLAMDP